MKRRSLLARFRRVVDVTQEGLLVRELLGAPRIVPFDEATESDRNDPRVARAFSPPIDATLAVARAAWQRFFDAPHAPHKAARGLIAQARALGASDIHIEPTANGSASVRVRIAGSLHDFATTSNARRLSAAFKGISACVPYRSDVVQEGSIPLEVPSETAADVRASFVPTVFGERIALRLFGRLLSLEELGLSPSTQAAFARTLEEARGLVVVAGSTGAGKTTTLYAALGYVARKRQGAHISLEDPVEQRLRNAGVAVDQIELDEARGITAEAMLAASLRQDIDVVCVGEIRSAAEAAFAVRAAHTGRLVLAGLHASSPEEARLRLLDLGCERTTLDATLRAVLHQSLLPSPCPCTSSPDETEEAGAHQHACTRCRGAHQVLRLEATLWSTPGSRALSSNSASAASSWSHPTEVA